MEELLRLLQMLDAMMSESTEQHKADFQAAFDADPMDVTRKCKAFVAMKKCDDHCKEETCNKCSIYSVAKGTFKTTKQIQST